MKTAQEKKLISAKTKFNKRKIPVRSELKEEHKSKQLQPFLNSLRKAVVTELARSSEQERRVDARALIADEGRDKLR